MAHRPVAIATAGVRATQQSLSAVQRALAQHTGAVLAPRAPASGGMAATTITTGLELSGDESALLGRLPVEVVHHIAGYLHNAELTRLSLTDTHLHGGLRHHVNSARLAIEARRVRSLEETKAMLASIAAIDGARLRTSPLCALLPALNRLPHKARALAFDAILESALSQPRAHRAPLLSTLAAHITALGTGAERLGAFIKTIAALDRLPGENRGPLVAELAWQCTSVGTPETVAQIYGLVYQATMKLTGAARALALCNLAEGMIYLPQARATEAFATLLLATQETAQPHRQAPLSALAGQIHVLVREERGAAFTLMLDTIEPLPANLRSNLLNALAGSVGALAATHRARGFELLAGAVAKLAAGHRGTALDGLIQSISTLDGETRFEAFSTCAALGLVLPAPAQRDALARLGNELRALDQNERVIGIEIIHTVKRRLGAIHAP